MRTKFCKTRLISFCLPAMLCGCATSDSCYQLTQTVRAHAAWTHFDTDHSLFFSDHTRDFARGWKAGYRNVLTGGDGQPPVLPPRRYWDPSVFCSVDTDGQQEWLKGFQCGAAQASRVPSGHYVRPNLSSCHGCFPGPSALLSQHDRSSRSPGDENQIQTASIRLLGIIPQHDVAPNEAVVRNEAIVKSHGKAPADPSQWFQVTSQSKVEAPDE